MNKFISEEMVKRQIKDLIKDIKVKRVILKSFNTFKAYIEQKLVIPLLKGNHKPRSIEAVKLKCLIKVLSTQDFYNKEKEEFMKLLAERMTSSELEISNIFKEGKELMSACNFPRNSKFSRASSFMQRTQRGSSFASSRGSYIKGMLSQRASTRNNSICRPSFMPMNTFDGRTKVSFKLDEISEDCDTFVSNTAHQSFIFSNKHRMTNPLGLNEAQNGQRPIGVNSSKTTLNMQICKSQSPSFLSTNVTTSRHPSQVVDHPNMSFLSRKSEQVKLDFIAPYRQSSCVSKLDTIKGSNEEDILNQEIFKEELNKPKLNLDKLQKQKFSVIRQHDGSPLGIQKMRARIKKNMIRKFRSRSPVPFNI